MPHKRYVNSAYISLASDILVSIDSSNEQLNKLASGSTRAGALIPYHTPRSRKEGKVLN